MNRMQFERRRRGWTQMDLGYHARIQTAEISKIETGRLKPGPIYAERLARALGIPADRLLEPVITDTAGAERC